MISSIDIRPGVSVLSVLRHLNYKPWFAIAEFIDNSIQSFNANRHALEAEGGEAGVLKVNVEIDQAKPARIVIRDNAAGISSKDYPRAFRPAALPPERAGLSEFGMGMKSAASWFCPRWTVRTSALGESVGRSVCFDIDKIVNDDIHELEITEFSAADNIHFTEIVLNDLHHPLATRTISKIKEHLSDIYREFLREGEVEITFRGERLSYSEPEVLLAPSCDDLMGEAIEWKKRIQFDFGGGLSVRGFVAIRKVASTTHAGLSLFRRGRLIVGSADEKYRPKSIFGSPNSYKYQRLFGELHLEGFEVSHTKDGFRWDENEAAFLDLLREHLDAAPLALLDQAERWRSRPPRERIFRAVESAVSNAVATASKHLPDLMPGLSEAELIETPSQPLPKAAMLASREFNVDFRDRRWLIAVEVSDDPAVGDWLSLGRQELDEKGRRRIEIRIAAGHPFMTRFASLSNDALEATLRLGMGVALSEVVARDSGIAKAGTFRRNLNEIVSQVLSLE